MPERLQISLTPLRLLDYRNLLEPRSPMVMPKRCMNRRALRGEQSMGKETSMLSAANSRLPPILTALVSANSDFSCPQRRSVRSAFCPFVTKAASVGKGSLQTFAAQCISDRYADKAALGRDVTPSRSFQSSLREQKRHHHGPSLGKPQCLIDRPYVAATKHRGLCSLVPPVPIYRTNVLQHPISIRSQAAYHVRHQLR